MPRKPIAKYCSKCEQEKPITEFSRAARASDGLQRWCRPCMRENNKRLYWADPEKARQRVNDYATDHRDETNERQRREYQEDPEKHRQLSDQYRRRYPERVRAYTQRYNHENKALLSERYRARYAADPERQKQQWRDSYQQNRAARRLSSIAYRATHRDSMAVAKRRWKQEHPEQNAEHEARRRALKLKTQVERIDRMRIIERDGSACYICGKVLTRREITIDHVFPLSKGGKHVYENLRVACRPCNSRKWNHLPEGYIV